MAVIHVYKSGGEEGGRAMGWGEAMGGGGGGVETWERLRCAGHKTGVVSSQGVARCECGR